MDLWVMLVVCFMALSTDLIDWFFDKRKNK